MRSDFAFPTILAIDYKQPIDFQEAVREDYPYFEIKPNTINLSVTATIPDQFKHLVQQNLAGAVGKSYTFTSADKNWTLSLRKYGLSVICRQYGGWEEFHERVEKAINNLSAIYRPPFFLHACVRFKNSVRREQLELVDHPWSNLISPWVCGPLSLPEVSTGVESLETKCKIRLPDEIGYIDATFILGIHHPSRDIAFIIESHAFNEVSKKGVNDVVSHLDTLHRQTWLFFRRCITDTLHNAMLPKPAE